MCCSTCTVLYKVPTCTALSHYSHIDLSSIFCLAVWNLSVSQWDTHMAGLTPAYRAGASLAKGRASNVDCSHFCQPSAVLEAWVDAMLLALQYHSPTSPSRRDSTGTANASPEKEWRLPGAPHKRRNVSEAPLGSCALLHSVELCSDIRADPERCWSSRVKNTLVSCEQHEAGERTGCRPAGKFGRHMCPARPGIHFALPGAGAE